MNSWLLLNVKKKRVENIKQAKQILAMRTNKLIRYPNCNRFSFDKKCAFVETPGLLLIKLGLFQSN